MLGVDGSSAVKVVLLSLAVELEGARPESLLTSFSKCDFALKMLAGTSDDESGLWIGCAPLSGRVGDGATVIGIGGFAGFVCS